MARCFEYLVYRQNDWSYTEEGSEEKKFLWKPVAIILARSRAEAELTVEALTESRSQAFKVVARSRGNAADREVILNGRSMRAAANRRFSVLRQQNGDGMAWKPNGRRVAR